MGYILHKGTTGRRGGEAYEAAGRGIKALCSGRWGREQSDMGCLAMTGCGDCHVGTLVPPRNDVKGCLERAGLEAVGYAD